MSAPPTTAIKTDTAGFGPINDQDNVTPNIYGPNGTTEPPDSPEIELAEHCSVKRTLQDYYWNLLEQMRFPGTLVQDISGNQFRTLTSSLKHKKGNRATLTITDEWVAGTTLVPPPDIFGVKPIEFNPAMEKNPLYTDNSDGQGALTDEDIMRIKQAVEAPQPGARTDNGNNPYDGTNVVVSDLWDSLLQKLRRGEDTYYLAGFMLTWTRFYFSPVKIDPGGYTQAPGSDTYGDILPSFFIRTQPDLELTLPFGDSISWLRLADAQDFDRTWFKVVRSWIVGQQGYWDGDVYTDYYGSNDNNTFPTIFTNPAFY
jgi:hypothetical protein